MSKKTVVSLFILAFFSQWAVAQNDINVLNTFFINVRNGNSFVLPYEILRQTRQLQENLKTITNNLPDTLITIRKACYQSLDIMQKSSSSVANKQQILELQFRGVQDQSNDIVGLSIQNISSVPAALFTESQKAALIQKLESPVPKKEVLIPLIGTLESERAISPLQQLSQPGNPAKVRWAAYLALARLGDQPSISLVNSKVRGVEVNDDMVYDIAPSIIYTRQRQLYDYLVELLYSNEKNCESANPDDASSINCAYRILELLAPEIEGFPITTSASGDLEVRNYQEALITAREWLSAHRDFMIKNVD
jgi:hypothetical protein